MPVAMNIPNALTMARITLTPVLVFAMLVPGATELALAVFVAGMVSDYLDGHLARSRGLITSFGKLMDPIADKLFIGSALACLIVTEGLAAWVVLTVFARELLVTGLRLAARREGVVIPANQLGKAKTVIQSAAVLVMIAAGTGSAVVQGLIYVMVAITVISGASYVAGFVRERRPSGGRLEPAAAG